MEKTSNKLLPEVGNEEESSSPLDEDDSGVSNAKTHLLEFAATKKMLMNDIHSLTHGQLSEFLEDFYYKKRGKINDLAQDIKNIRGGLQKYFLENCNVDIVDGKEFENANLAYEVVFRGVPKKKCTSNRARIATRDLETMYLGEAFDTDAPETLQNKVFFDINLYICNRGKEFLRIMKKNDFEIGTDSLNRKFVYLKFNPKFGMTLKDFSNGDRVESEYGDRMYERRGDPRCPVASFIKYHSHLHPMCDFFWQRTKRSVNKADYVWYDHTALGYSTLSKMMQRISLTAGLADIYTNYSIRSSYIAAIESMCRNAMASTTLKQIAYIDKDQQDVNREVQRNIKKEPPDDMDASSDYSELTETDNTDIVDEVSVGMKDAQSKVLDIIQGLKAKDLQGFIDWLMTFKLKRDNAGLIITCQPVNQPITCQPVNQPIIKQPGVDHMVPHIKESSQNGDKPVGKMFSQPKKPLDINVKREPPEKNHTVTSENSSKISDDKPNNYGISIQQVEFDAINNTHCSCATDLLPMKIVAPSQDTLLISGIQNNVQFLIHNRKGDQLPEELHSRVYYSEHNLDVAEVAALASYVDDTKTAESHISHVNENINGRNLLIKSEKPTCSYENLKRALSTESQTEEKCVPPLKKRFHAVAAQGYLDDAYVLTKPVTQSVSKPANCPLNLVVNSRR